jgi:diguanylate cyclase (GGDEF)-like protein
VWMVDQGLPQNTVTAILQSRDGYIWLGTEEGLARFDGVRFAVFDRRRTPGFSDNYVSALLEDRSGSLWIGTRQGGLLRLSGGVFTPLTRKEGLPHNFVRCLAEDRAGRVWVGTDAGLAVWTGKGFSIYTTRQGLSSDSVRSISEDVHGDLWIGTRGGGVNRLHSGVFTAYRKENGLPSDDIWSTLVARDGTLWVGTAGAGLVRFSGGQMTTITTRDGLPNDFIGAIFEDRRGNLWVGTDGGGLSRLAGGRWTSWTMREGLSNDFVQAFLEDREGSLWIGTQGGGLNRLEDQKFTLYTSREGLSRDVVWSIFEDRRGAIWIGTLGGGLNRLEGGQVTTLSKRDGLPSDSVWSTLEGADGSLWIGTRGGGLARWKDGKATSFGTREGLAGNIVLSLLEDRKSGALWVGTSSGLSRLADGKLVSFTTREGLPSNNILALAQSRDGEIWIGTRGGGVAHLGGGKFLRVPAPAGSPGETVYDIHEDATGAIWCATAGDGLHRIAGGRVRAYGSRDGLFDDLIYRILEDGSGRFWMSCNRGIFRVDRKDFDLYDAGKIKTIPTVAYSRADGLRNPECNGGFQPAGWRGRDGRIWFPTNAGAAVVDPGRLPINTLPPPVALEGLLVDGRDMSLLAPLRIPPGRGSFEFHYTGLSFLAPDRVNFRYRLDGFDRDWVEAGQRRVAYYTNLPSGQYTFRVLASNDAGLWSPRGASVALIVEPRFYQTFWFFLLCACAAVAMGEGAYVLRVRQLKARQRELEELVAERTRQLAEANQVLERLSLVDPLTGIANRRQFEKVLEFERRRSERTGGALALLMIDIDEFKVLNDAFGHLTGDESLKRVAEELTRCVRGAGDLVARYGGEEFSVILPGTDAAGATVLAERVRARVAGLAIPLSPHRPGETLTVSIGVAGVVRGHDVAPEALVAAADQALYRAKQDGRNRVERGALEETSAQT